MGWRPVEPYPFPQASSLPRLGAIIAGSGLAATQGCRVKPGLGVHWATAILNMALLPESARVSHKESDFRVSCQSLQHRRGLRLLRGGICPWGRRYAMEDRWRLMYSLRVRTVRSTGLRKEQTLCCPKRQVHPSCVGRSLVSRRAGAVEYDRGRAIIAKVEPRGTIGRPTDKCTGRWEGL